MKVPTGGRVLTWVNPSTYPITLKHQSVDPAIQPNRRFNCPGGVDFVLRPGASVDIVWSINAGYWIVKGI